MDTQTDVRPAKQRILALLSANPDTWYAVHELNLYGISENAAASRLAELGHPSIGLVEGRRREGKAYKEWRIRRQENA